MKTDQNIPSYKEKIEQIGTGLFTNLSESVIKLPASIISNVVADDYGYVWFIASKSYEQREEFEGEFPGRLNLFRKQVNFFMELEGEARIVSDPEEIFMIRSFAEPLVRAVRLNTVLVKMKILKVSYHEGKAEKRIPFAFKAMNRFSSLLGNIYGYRRGLFPSSR